MTSYFHIFHSPEEQQRMDVEAIVEDLAKKIVDHGFYSKKLTNQDEELLDILCEHIEDNFENFHLEEDCYVI